MSTSQTSDVFKRSIHNTFDELTDTTETPKEVYTEIPTPASEEVHKEEGLFNEVPKEESDAPKEEVPKEASSEDTPDISEGMTDESPKKEDLNIKKEGERIEIEDEDERASSERPKEAEEMTPGNSSPSVPSVTPPSTPGFSRPTFPPIRPTASPPEVAPPSRPALVPVQPSVPSGFPTNTYPNYWDNPNWGNWGRFVPSNIPTWAQTIPSFGYHVPSVPTITAIAAIPSMSGYNPSNLSPARYSPFAMSPNQGVPTFSFVVPRNRYPSGGGGRGFDYPGSRPTFSDFQPSYQPRYLPPSGGPTQGLFPGIGGYYPGVGESRPSFGLYPELVIRLEFIPDERNSRHDLNPNPALTPTDRTDHWAQR